MSHLKKTSTLIGNGLLLDIIVQYPIDFEDLLNFSFSSKSIFVAICSCGIWFRRLKDLYLIDEDHPMKSSNYFTIFREKAIFFFTLSLYYPPGGGPRSDFFISSDINEIRQILEKNFKSSQTAARAFFGGECGFICRIIENEIASVPFQIGVSFEVEALEGVWEVCGFSIGPPKEEGLHDFKLIVENTGVYAFCRKGAVGGDYDGASVVPLIDNEYVWQEKGMIEQTLKIRNVSVDMSRIPPPPLYARALHPSTKGVVVTDALRQLAFHSYPIDVAVYGHNNPDCDSFGQEWAKAFDY